MSATLTPVDTSDDQKWREAVAIANIPTLLMVLVLTGAQAFAEKRPPAWRGA
jgi:hypothetical protein